MKLATAPVNWYSVDAPDDRPRVQLESLLINKQE